MFDIVSSAEFRTVRPDTKEEERLKVIIARAQIPAGMEKNFTLISIRPAIKSVQKLI